MVALDEDGMSAADNVSAPKNNDKRLDIAAWQLAFDRSVSAIVSASCVDCA